MQCDYDKAIQLLGQAKHQEQQKNIQEAIHLYKDATTLLLKHVEQNPNQPCNKVLIGEIDCILKRVEYLKGQQNLNAPVLPELVEICPPFLENNLTQLSNPQCEKIEQEFAIYKAQTDEKINNLTALVQKLTKSKHKL